MYEDVCYVRNYLTEVVARIDFIVPIDEIEKALPSKLANELSTDFQISEPIDAIAARFQFGGDGVTEQVKKELKEWRFFGIDREKQLSLAAPFLFISFKHYISFEDMKAQFTRVINSVGKAFPDAKAGRFGLRYVNVINDIELANPLVWDEYIDAGLLGTIGFFNQPNHLIRLIQVTELKHEDITVRFQFGMPNPDYPAIIKKPQFVLDYDAFVQSAHEFTNTLIYLDQAHEQIQGLFERSITPRLRELMRERRRTEV